MRGAIIEIPKKYETTFPIEFIGRYGNEIYRFCPNKKCGHYEPVNTKNSLIVPLVHKLGYECLKCGFSWE